MKKTIIKLISYTVIFVSLAAMTTVVLNIRHTANIAVTDSEIKNRMLTYKEAEKSKDWIYEGLNVLTYNGIPYMFYSNTGSLERFNYTNNLNDYKKCKKVVDFITGLACISTYMGTGDDRYLNIAENTAKLLDKILPDNGLLPYYSLDDKKIIDIHTISPGTNGQASVIEYISYLAKIDKSFIPLLDRLANGLIKYGLNQQNNLAWFRINDVTGQPVKDSVFGYESQLGSQSVSVAQALLFAYDVNKDKTEYRDKAISILNSIWNTRNKSTNLISEVYDVRNNRVGEILYPYQYFRYDDMGGAYIRGLTLAYQLTNDKHINNIAKLYINAVLNGTWDTQINGGAFRYVSSVEGKPIMQTVEIMHGLFLGTLLEANDIFYNGQNTDILNKCIINANHTIIDDFDVKNHMIPHQLYKTGKYYKNDSDSELGYAVLQYPVGYGSLSNATGDNKYRDKDNTIIKVLVNRFKKGDNINSPKGFVNILETQPPYNYEMDYSKPVWMVESLYLPSYLLFNSIHPSKTVKINWYKGTNPGVFGLVCDMPYWDLDKVQFKNKILTLNEVNGKGDIDLIDMGYIINKVYVDGKLYNNHNLTIVHTLSGTHSYRIIFH